MYGKIDSIGSQPTNPFIKKPGAQGVQNNPFVSNKQEEDRTNFNPQNLFASNTVGLKKDTPELQERTIGIG